MTVIEGVTEAQRTTVACPRSHRVRTVPGLEFKPSDCKVLGEDHTFLVIALDISELPSVRLGLAGLGQVPHSEFVVRLACAYG